MCGIAGIVSVDDGPPTQRELRAMAATMRHRGPDDEGISMRGRVGLTMRRLAVIDVQGGQQPAYNEDGTIAVVCNGEIYNYRELRQRLQAKGHSFRSQSDTEVLAHLWEQQGPGCVESLNGMFAIAVHDAMRGEVTLLRDHLGIKPLFYAMTGDALIFGSEVKALLASGRVKRELDADALAQFLAWEYTPGEKTPLRAVRKLEPGRRLRFDVNTGKTRIETYWDVPLPRAEDAAGRGSRDLNGHWPEQIEASIDRAVNRQMISDVPLGAFLSGGVDSSLVVSAMGPEARTFSIGFDDPTYNELPWAKRVATHLNVQHIVDVLRSDVHSLFDHLMQFMDDPIGDFSILPTYLVTRHARGVVTVALSGDGGDELFAGYETYEADRLARRWQRVPKPARHVVEQLMAALPPTRKKKGLINKARRFAEGLAEQPQLGHARWRIFLGQTLREALFTTETKQQMHQPIEQHIHKLADRARDADPLTRSLYIDTKSYLPDNCLVKMDRMSMANSLEARVPMLDKDLVELAFQVPAEQKLNGKGSKALLKQLARRRVPNECVDRPKEGFSIPMKHWLAGPFRERMEHLLNRERLQAEGLFEPTVVESLKRAHLAGRANHSHLLWSLMVFEDWRQRWGV